MKKMTVKEINDYIKSHGVLLPNKQVFLTKPLYAFKRVVTSGNSWYDVVTTKTGLSKILNDDIGTGSSTKAIANLIIPKGAIVNTLDSEWNSETDKSYKKLRASTAFCWSIIRLKDNFSMPVAASVWDSDFHYHSISLLETHIHVKDLSIEYGYCNNLLIATQNAFDTSRSECASGIHFFLESQDAVTY